MNVKINKSECPIAAFICGWRNQIIFEWSGRWDLYYFKSQAAAKEWAARWKYSRMIETTRDEIWRVAVPSKGTIVMGTSSPAHVLSTGEIPCF